MTRTEKKYPYLDNVVMGIIFLNSIIIFLQSSGFESRWLDIVDMLCTLIFICEMLLKMKTDGFVSYWRNGWNRLDGALVILSLPSILTSFLPVTNLSFLLIFRLLRAFRFFRVIHFFPGVEQIGKSFKKALQESFSLFVGYFIIICIFALFSTSLFGNIVPQYFGTPMDSIYSIFRLFTIEGWYDIPEAFVGTCGTWTICLIRLYFALLLIIGGVIGLSLINSVFVDAMVSDNNDNLQERIKALEEKIDALIYSLENNHEDSCLEEEKK